MKKFIFALILLLLPVLFLGAGCDFTKKTSTDEDQTASQAPEKGAVSEDASMMFIQNAQSGIMTPVADKDDSYTLALKDVQPTTIYFSDRPERITGQAPMDKFLEGYSFNSDNPPNAAIDVLDENNKPKVAVVELRNPQYDKDAKTLSYDTTIIKDNTTGGLAHYNDAKLDSLPENFDNVALFIDDCPDIRIKCWSHGNVDCGHPEIGTCWSWAYFMCIPCNDPNKACDKKYKNCCKDDCHYDLF